MRIILTITIAFIFSIAGISISFSQIDSINQKKDGKKDGYWIIYGNMRNLPDYDSKNVIEEGVYTRSRKTGIWKKYWPNGKLKSEIYYQNGRSTGSYTTYFKNGNIEEKGTMQNGMLVGEYKLFWSNGNSRQQKAFNEEGTTEGEVQFFYESGTQELSFEAIDGKETGQATWFYENGDVKKETSYDSGIALESSEFKMVNPPINAIKPVVDKGPEIQGAFNNANSSLVDNYGKTYDKDKNILMDGEFKNGRLYNGRHYIYDEFGLLEHIKEYREGIFAGNGIIGKKDRF